MATEKVKAVELDTQPAVTSTRQLKNELKSLKDTMLSTEQGTEEYNQALRKSAEISHVLSEQTQEIKRSQKDFGQIAQNASKALGGMVAGFQAAQAAMNIFGVENEDVMKSMKKMQDLMAITQAFPAIDSAIKGFQGLKTVITTATGATSKFGKALVGTGLGALAVALGYIVTHFEEISKWLDKVTGQTDLLGTIADNVVGGLNAAWAGLVQTLKAVGNAIYTYVTAPFKSIVAAIKAYSDTTGSFGDKLKAAAHAMKETSKKEWGDVAEDFKEIGDKSAEAFAEGFEKNKKRRKTKKLSKEELKEIETLKKELAKFDKDAELAAKKEKDKELAALSQSQKEKEDKLKEFRKKGIISEEEYQKRLTLITETYNKQRNEIEYKYAAEASKKREEYAKHVVEIEKQQEANVLALRQQSLNQESIELNNALKHREITFSEYINAQKGLISQQYELEKQELSDTYNRENGLIQQQIAERQKLLETSGISDEQRNTILAEIETLTTQASTIYTNYVINLENVNNEFNKKIADVNQREINSQMNSVRAHFDEMFAAFDTITSVADGVSSKWTDAFDMMANGVINLTQKVREGSATWEDYGQMAVIAFASTGKMLEALAEQEDETNKEGFEKQKSLRITSVVMDMLGGIASAWISAMSPANAFLTLPGQIALGAASSTATAILGAAQIAAIKKQQFNSGKSSASATPNVSAIQSITAPVQYTQDVRGANIEGAIKDSRVYVVESDITNVQNKVKVSENENRF